MELKLYTEHWTEEGKLKQLRHICKEDFLHEVQGLIDHVLNLGGQVMYYNAYNGYKAITH